MTISLEILAFLRLPQGNLETISEDVSEDSNTKVIVPSLLPLTA